MWFLIHIYQPCLLRSVITPYLTFLIPSAGISLLWVAALGVAVLYIYSVVSFAFLHESFLVDSDEDLFCDNLFECFVTVIRYGLIDGLGLVSDCPIFK